MATPTRIAICGGGLAGLSAAVALADALKTAHANRSFQIELFESRRQLGGRATSFRDPQTGALVDHCQHVSLGCCTNLNDFCRRAGLSDWLERHRTLHFFAPDGQRCDVSASRWLPAPLRLLPSLLRLKYLSLRERWGVIRALRKLASKPEDEWGMGNGECGVRKRVAANECTIERWLQEHGQSKRAIELFWTPVIVSALSETIDRAGVAPVRKVFVDAFLGPRSAYEMLIPRVPLAEFYGERLQAWLATRGVQVRLGCGIRLLDGDASGVSKLEFIDGETQSFDFIVLAVPWRRVMEMLSDSLRAALPELQAVSQIESAPITAVHFWFDRPITDLPHAVLPGRTSQWMFNRGRQSDGSCLYQVVISASRDLAGSPREEIIEIVKQELTAVWPEINRAKLQQARLVTEQHAVFAVLPGVDRLRPAQKTTVPNLFLAGDWTATGWPATMEGAVRSGYLAAEAVLAAVGRPQKILTDDLPKPWLTRWLIRRSH